MTQIKDLTFRSRNAFAYLEREDGFKFWLNFDLQCSGAVLVESRQPNGLMSKYTDLIFRDGTLDDRMYGGNNELKLTEEELGIIQDIRMELRNANRHFWDEKYAPGASFTGHDITPVNGIGDFS